MAVLAQARQRSGWLLMVQSRRSGAPTVRDVARAAGVSAQTVSRALNTPEKVGDSTLARVMKAVGELHYEPSPMARGLATNRSGVIGVIDSGSRVLGQILLRTGVESAAREFGYSARTLIFSDGEDSQDAHQLVIRSLRPERIEGLIIMANTELHLETASLASSRIPVVLVSGDDAFTGEMSTMTLNQRGGAAQMIAHLTDRGYSRIGHITGPVGWVDSDQRRLAWEEAGGDPGRMAVGDWTPESGYRLAGPLLDSGVDAIFASNDYMALGAMRACKERGLSIPGDVGIGGFDDVVGSAFFDPPLTTVRQPFENLGTRAVELLMETINGADTHQETLGSELVIREST